MPVQEANASFRKAFEEMLNQIPDGPGSCIVIGYKKEESKIIDLVKNQSRLRKEVRSGTKLWNDKKLSRYRWIQEQVRLYQFESIKIQIID
jgi:hypothetical protein